MMNQSKLGSWIEILFGTAIGYTVALISQHLIFPLFDIHVSTLQSMHIAAYFTVISLIRGYVIRRWFNARLHKAALRMAAEIKGEDVIPEWRDLQTPVGPLRRMSRTTAGVLNVHPTLFRRLAAYSRIRRQPFFGSAERGRILATKLRDVIS